MGCAYDKAQPNNTMLLEDLFTMHVYNHKEHGMVIRSHTQAASGVDLLSRFEAVKMTVKFGKNKKTSNLECALLSWPRDPAATILISFKDVYSALGLKQFRGKSWRWISSGFSAWHSWMSEAGYSAHLVPSHAMTQACVSEVVSQKVSN